MDTHREARAVDGGRMKIALFGLGYVGSVTAACLAALGHDVIGVDVNRGKVDSINSGHPPVLEPGLGDLVAQATSSGRLRATDDPAEAVEASTISLVCVGTPSRMNGSLDLATVEAVCGQIGEALATKGDYHVVTIRSTVLPGTVRERLLPILESASAKRVGVDFGLAMNPEFLREASAISDFYQPSVTVIGEFDERSGGTVEDMYEQVVAPVARVALETAEMAKYANNAFHATKIAFANEVGALAKAHGIDGREVMDILIQDKQLNISPAYLRPGYAFGGSCLPKDTRALLYRSKEMDIESPLLASLLVSNQLHANRAIDFVERSGFKKVGVLGLSFKAGTDDVRESPMVPLVETLVGRGYQVAVYDEHVRLSKLIGSNKTFLEQEIPHIASLMSSDLQEVISQNEVIVVGNASAAFRDVPGQLRSDQLLIDLVGLDPVTEGGYEGICW
jgi:GDP-mannose 6-dehydrogenase